MLDAILNSTNPLLKIGALLLLVGVTFASTWLGMKWTQRWTERKITRLMREAGFEYVDDGKPPYFQWIQDQGE